MLSGLDDCELHRGASLPTRGSSTLWIENPADYGGSLLVNQEYDNLWGGRNLSGADARRFSGITDPVENGRRTGEYSFRSRPQSINTSTRISRIRSGHFSRNLRSKSAAQGDRFALLRTLTQLSESERKTLPIKIQLSAAFIAMAQVQGSYLNNSPMSLEIPASPLTAKGLAALHFFSSPTDRYIQGLRV
jgi:hypothetical protein